MSTALRTSASDLSRFLQKALMNSDLDQKIATCANRAGDAIANANRSDYPELKSSVSKSGPRSWEISFTAPSLWVGTFGNMNSEGKKFLTRLNVDATGGLRGKL